MYRVSSCSSIVGTSVGRETAVGETVAAGGVTITKGPEGSSVVSGAVLLRQPKMKNVAMKCSRGYL